jgi:hypothetical protein
MVDQRTLEVFADERHCCTNRQRALDLLKPWHEDQDPIPHPQLVHL